jgi:hypothetical protein
MASPFDDLDLDLDLDLFTSSSISSSSLSVREQGATGTEFTNSLSLGRDSLTNPLRLKLLPTPLIWFKRRFGESLGD